MLLKTSRGTPRDTRESQKLSVGRVYSRVQPAIQRSVALKSEKSFEVLRETTLCSLFPSEKWAAAHHSTRESSIFSFLYIELGIATLEELVLSVDVYALSHLWNQVGVWAYSIRLLVFNTMPRYVLSITSYGGISRQESYTLSVTLLQFTTIDLFFYFRRTLFLFSQVI